jgi:hypothetical protein
LHDSVIGCLASELFSDLKRLPHRRTVGIPGGAAFGNAMGKTQAQNMAIALELIRPLRRNGEALL